MSRSDEMGGAAFPVARNEYGVEIGLPDIGLGTMRTSATYAALFIQLEGDRHSQISVLASVMEALGIDPAEVAHEQSRPDCTDEVAYGQWRDEADRLAERNKRKEES